MGTVISQKTFGLFEVAYSCRLYEQLTGYDVSLKRLRATAPEGIDLFRSDHRDAVLKWLREWGCRQFAISYNELSSSQLLEWAETWVARLPDTKTNLVDLDETELSNCTSAYADLWVRPASYSHKGSTEILKTFGPVGGAKALYVTRPRLFPPWDRYIITKLGYGVGGPKDFGRYLQRAAAQLRALASRASCDVEDIPRLLGRPDSSPPKLVDECNWTIITKECVPPTLASLRLWLKWAEMSADG